MDTTRLGSFNLTGCGREVQCPRCRSFFEKTSVYCGSNCQYCGCK